ncbi:hypothetical protein VSQ48_04350 [Candidatus Ventrimonas sp. KK005]
MKKWYITLKVPPPNRRHRFRYVHLGMSIQDGLGISKKEMDREDERKNQGAAVNGNGLCCCLERRKGRR